MRISHVLIVSVAALLVLAILTMRSAADEGETTNEQSASPVAMAPESALDWTFALACVIALTHAASPWFRSIIEPHEKRFGSFGGGMAAGYVFIHLFGELDSGHKLVGDRIHLFILAGFLFYCGVEYYLQQSRGRENSPLSDGRGCLIEVVLGSIYTWLIIYSMPESLMHNGMNVLPIVLALILHLSFADAHLCRQYPRHFVSWGRYVVATAAIVGWLTDLFYFADNPFVSDLLTALLAGSVMYKLFKHELPDNRESSFFWFLIGTLSFLGLDLLARGV